MDDETLKKEHKFFDWFGGRKFFLILMVSLFYAIAFGITFFTNKPTYWNYLEHFTSSYFWLIFGYTGINISQKGLNKIKPKNY
jgi:hypothetical protein